MNIELQKQVVECAKKIKPNLIKVQLIDKIKEDLYFDSFERIELMIEIERQFNIKLDFFDEKRIKTIDDIVNTITRILNKKND